MTKHFNPGWKITLFTVGFLPLLLWLGFWQLDREREKIVLQADHTARGLAPALPLESVDWSAADLAYLKISASGSYDNERAILLDNRVFQGRVGYELLMLFVTDKGLNLLVNRGWIEAGRTRSELPEIKEVESPVQINATIYVPLDEPFLLNNLQEERQTPWPKVIQSIRVEELSDLLEVPLLPYTVRLVENSPGLEQNNWPTVNMSPEKHRAYATQWFVMALALMVMYLYLGFKHPVSKTEREQQ